MAFSTKHTRDTENPQTYAEHFKVSLIGSLLLIFYGLGGLVHAILPEIKCFQFWTSSGVIKIYRHLELSRRHDPEVERIFGKERAKYVNENRGK